MNKKKFIDPVTSVVVTQTVYQKADCFRTHANQQRTYGQLIREMRARGFVPLNK